MTGDAPIEGRCGDCGAVTDTLPCPFCAVVHVTPRDDLIDHEAIGQSCPCGATAEVVKREDGSVGWVIVHHSLDGRERDE